MNDSPSIKIRVISLFPELFREFSQVSFVGKAREAGGLDLGTVSLREFGLGRHQSVDDTPYGGGSGMVLRVDCVMNAIERAEAEMGGRSHRVLMTPQGQPYQASLAEELSRVDRITLICGRYEGFDDRLRSFIDQEISLGDFVLTGGEIPAMAVIEGLIRFRKGVLGNQESVLEESFSPSLQGGLEYPHYTRPASFRGLDVPAILKSGDHAKISDYRREQSQIRTLQRRPELVPAKREK